MDWKGFFLKVDIEYLEVFLGARGSRYEVWIYEALVCLDDFI